MICILIVVLVVSFVPAQGTVCKSDVDCGTGECCYIPSPFQVMSRRRAAVDVVGLPLAPLDFSHQNGTCERYRIIGEHCNPLEKANGHCGCGHGLYCHRTPPPTIAALHTLPKTDRRMILPGTYACAETV